MKYPEQRQKDWCLAWVGQREVWGAVALIDMGFYFGVIKNFQNYIEVVVLQHCKCTKFY